jgi:hypothetical protein
MLESSRSKRSPPSAWMIVRLIAAAIAILGLITLGIVVVLQHNRDADRYSTAHAAYLSGNCVVAVHDFDILLGDGRLLDTGGVESAARSERKDCNDLLVIDRSAQTDPANALTQYGAML